MAYVVGIDIGTYETKGVLVNKEGKILLQTAVAHQLEIPHQGWAEHDAEETWWNDVKRISKFLVSEGNLKYGIKKEEIEAIGVSSIAPAVVPVDAEGHALRKAILYGVDTRTGAEIQQLNDLIGKETIFEISGQALSSQSGGPKILWIRNHEPEVYEKAVSFLSGTGYVVYKLSGQGVIDHYTAAAFSPLYNIANHTWDDKTVQVVVDPKKLPRLAWSHEVVGEITEKAAEETGLSPGTKVIAGTADALSESISIGAIKTGDLMLMYGSSTFFILVTKDFLPTNQLWASIHAVPQLKTITGGTSTAGSLTRWFLEQWGLRSQDADIGQLYGELTALAMQSPPGAKGLLTLPYFSGERTPIHNPHAKGVLFGLSLHHTTSDIYRSILEGIAYSIRHNIEEIRSLGVEINRIIAVGGGTKSPLWMQSVSDSCGLVQMVPKTTIGASYGNAYLCALALGWYSSIDQIVQWIEYTASVEPQDELKPLHDKNYRNYLKLYQSTKDLMEDL